MLTQSKLKEVLNYDPSTGVFTWKKCTNNRTIVGQRAGFQNIRGYRYI
jgi:hypothetical protein